MGLLISGFQCCHSVNAAVCASVSAPCEELLGFGWGLNHPEGCGCVGAGSSLLGGMESLTRAPGWGLPRVSGWRVRLVRDQC